MTTDHPDQADFDLVASAHAVLLAWDASISELADAVSNLSGSLADWLRAHDLRQCDGCGRITDANDSPVWVNGLCTGCDPSLDPPTDAAMRAGGQ